MGEIRVKSENLFDVTTVTNVYLDAQGVEHSSEVSRTSDYIPVTANTLYTLGMTGGSSSLNLTAYCFYDSNKEFLSFDTYQPSTIGNIVSITTPNNCAYFRFTYNYLRNLVEFVSGVYNTFPPYFLNLPSHEKTANGWKDIPTHTMTATGWQGELTSQSPLEFRATGQSLLDWRIDGAYGGVGDWDETEQKYVIPVNVRSGNLYSGAWEQGYWAYSDGTAGPGLTYIRTAKMLCKGNTKYEFVCSLPDGSKDYGFVFWGANDNFIGETHSSDVQNTPVKYSATSPANARMMAINIARYSDGERRPADILSFDLYELHETNLYTDAQLMDGDSLDFATDQTSIPITQGDNTLTVGTAVQPSKVFVKFEG